MTKPDESLTTYRLGRMSIAVPARARLEGGTFRVRGVQITEEERPDTRAAPEQALAAAWAAEEARLLEDRAYHERTLERLELGEGTRAALQRERGRPEEAVAVALRPPLLVTFRLVDGGGETAAMETLLRQALAAYVPPVTLAAVRERVGERVFFLGHGGVAAGYAPHAGESMELGFALGPGAELGVSVWHPEEENETSVLASLGAALTEWWLRTDAKIEKVRSRGVTVGGVDGDEVVLSHGGKVSWTWLRLARKADDAQIEVSMEGPASELARLDDVWARALCSMDFGVWRGAP